MPLAETTPPDWSDWIPTWDKFVAFLGAAGWNIVRVIVTIVVCAVIGYLLKFVIRRVVSRIVNGAKSKANVDDTQALDRSPLAAVRLVQRTRTLGSILQNIVNITLVIIAIVLTVQVLAPDILGSLTLLTAAIGAGLGFGAQNIVKDVLNGIFIVVEDQVGIGDVVDLGLAIGIVEYVSVRVTHVRDVNGTLWYVRNGEITRIGNMSQGWSRVIVDVSVPRGTELETAEDVLHEAASVLAKEPRWRSRIVGKPETWGLEAATADALIIRVVMRTRSASRDDVAQELRARLLAAADGLELPETEDGVVHPALASVVLTGSDGAFRVRGANPPKTKPQPVQDSEPSRPSWKPRKRPKTPPEETP